MSKKIKIMLVLLLSVMFINNCKTVDDEKYVYEDETNEEIVKVLPQITRFEADPDHITEGDHIRLYWKTYKAYQIYLKLWDVYKPVNWFGNKVIYGLKKDHEFKIKAVNKDGTVYETIIVKVKPDLDLPTIVYFKCNPNPVVKYAEYYTSWKVLKATTVYIKNYEFGNWQKVSSEYGYGGSTTNVNVHKYLKATNKNGTVYSDFILYVK